VKKKAVRILSMILLLALVCSSSIFATAAKTQATGAETSVGSVKTDNVEDLGVNYRTHIQNDGWETGWTADGEASGTEGRSLRLEGIQIKLSGDVPEGANIQYRTHVQNVGWETEWTVDGDTAGTEGRSLRLEGIKIQLVNMPDYSVQYRTHVENAGWETKWFTDGETAGTEGRSLRLEGIEIRIVNLTGYNAILSTIAKLTEADYTVASWENLQTVMVDNAVNGYYDQTAIDSATARIQAADDALELRKKEEPPSPGGGGSATVSVTGIVVDQTSLTLIGVNTTDTITAAIKPTNATNPSINWSSSDETVAKVNNGLVTAVALGTADITATAAGNGAIKAVTAVTVESPAAPSAPSYAIDFSSETTAEIVPESVEYADNSEFTAAKTGTGVKVPLNPEDTVKTLYFRVKAAGITPVGDAQWLDIPARPQAPGPFLDGINQIVGAVASTDYDVNVVGSSDMVKIKSDEDGIIDCSYAAGVTSGPGKTALRLRYPAGLSCFASAWTSTIAVTQIKSIAVTTPPTKKVYTIGSSLDFSGLVVTGTSYENDATVPLTITADNISGFDSTAAAAVQTLTVTVGGKQANFDISVKAEGSWPLGLSSDDSANTMSGLTSAMEFSVDGTHWTTYDETTPNLPDLTGKIALQVRMAETATQTAGPPTTFNFTKAVNYTVTPNGTVGTADVASIMTTELTLIFDAEPIGLSITNIYLNGAQKGELTGTGLTRTLTISQVAGVDPGNSTDYFVKVYILSPDPDAYAVVNTGRAVENISLAPKLSGEKFIAYFINQPTSFQLRFRFTETVTYYYVLKKYTGDLPAAMTPAEIKSAPTTTGLLGKETLFYKGITGLTPLTKYVVYLYAEDSAGNPALFYAGNSLTPTAMLTVTTTDYSDADKAWLDAESIAEVTYVIPIADQTDQEAETAWVQAAVNSGIKYGSTATVTWSATSKYDVSVIKGTSQMDTFTITVTEME